MVLCDLWLRRFLNCLTHGEWPRHLPHVLPSHLNNLNVCRLIHHLVQIPAGFENEHAIPILRFLQVPLLRSMGSILPWVPNLNHEGGSFLLGPRGFFLLAQACVLQDAQGQGPPGPDLVPSWGRGLRFARRRLADMPPDAGNVTSCLNRLAVPGHYLPWGFGIAGWFGHHADNSRSTKAGSFAHDSAGTCLDLMPFFVVCLAGKWVCSLVGAWKPWRQVMGKARSKVALVQ